MSDQPDLLRPTPRRTFDLTPLSTDDSAPPSPDNFNAEVVDSKLKAAALSTPDKTRSFLNLTASTLYGIYSPTGEDGQNDLQTPWGTGAQTPANGPAREASRPVTFSVTEKPAGSPRPRVTRGSSFSLILRAALLFLFGIAYGVIVTHLHDRKKLIPVQVDFVDRTSWKYLTFWGLSGVTLGSLLPWFDVFWEETFGSNEIVGTQDRKRRVSMTTSERGDEDGSGSSSERYLGADWNPVVRSVGAFVGIAFAIVRTFRNLSSTVSSNPTIEETPVALHIAGRINSRHRQSSHLVSGRQVKTRLHTLRSGRCPGHLCPSRRQPRHGPISSFSLLKFNHERQHSWELYARRSLYIRRNICLDLGRERAFL